jgi:hypothetical protein
MDSDDQSYDEDAQESQSLEAADDDELASALHTLGIAQSQLAATVQVGIRRAAWH